MGIECSQMALALRRYNHKLFSVLCDTLKLLNSSWTNGWKSLIQSNIFTKGIMTITPDFHGDEKVVFYAGYAPD